MYIKTLQLKNFRCFTEFELSFNEPFALITGSNGSGKTSLLEALHYACYLRSFRTHTPRELVAFQEQTFVLKVALESNDLEHELQIGFSPRKKLVKIDQNPIDSYKQLLDYYRTITLTEDDLQLVKGSPEERRLFLDQAVTLLKPDFLNELRNLKAIVTQRNALLDRGTPIIDDSYVLWTNQLIKSSQIIQQERIAYLQILERYVNQLLGHFAHLQGSKIEFCYQPKIALPDTDAADWLPEQSRLVTQEYALGRSVFGAHLDDVSITFKGHTAKHFSSRGQQKLIIMLLKLAQLEQLKEVKGPAIFLLDDFMNDFDKRTASQLLVLIGQSKSQVLFTCPVQMGYFEELLMGQRCQVINLEK